MKVVFVVGFFNPVEISLRKEFQHEFDAGALVFMSIGSPKYPPNLNKFKAHFFEVLSQSHNDTIYIFAADMRNRELVWVRASIEGIVSAAQCRETGKSIQLVFFPNAQDTEALSDAIAGCELRGQTENHTVAEAELRAHLNGKKALCVRGSQQTGFADALRRANIEFANFEEHFDEIDLAYGSNIGRTLKEAAKRYDCLLYAWGELKYLQPAIGAKWSALHQGKTPAAVVARFKQAVLGADSQIRGTVTTPDGAPVEGAAIKIAHETIYTSAEGQFAAHVKRNAAVNVVVALEEFTAPGSWEVVSAPGSAAPDASIQITVKRR